MWQFCYRYGSVVGFKLWPSSLIFVFKNFVFIIQYLVVRVCYLLLCLIMPMSPNGPGPLLVPLLKTTAASKRKCEKNKKYWTSVVFWKHVSRHLCKWSIYSPHCCRFFHTVKIFIERKCDSPGILAVIQHSCGTVIKSCRSAKSSMWLILWRDWNVCLGWLFHTV